MVQSGLARQLPDGGMTLDHAGQCPAETLHVLVDVGEAPPHVLQVTSRDEHGRVELCRPPRAVRGRLDRRDLVLQCLDSRGQGGQWIVGWGSRGSSSRGSCGRRWQGGSTTSRGSWSRGGRSRGGRSRGGRSRGGRSRGGRSRRSRRRYDGVLADQTPEALCRFLGAVLDHRQAARNVVRVAVAYVVVVVAVLVTTAAARMVAAVQPLDDAAEGRVDALEHRRGRAGTGCGLPVPPGDCAL